MRSRAMKSLPLKRGHDRGTQNDTPSLPTTQLLRQICDEFCELRQQKFNCGNDRFMCGFAAIGGRSVLMLTHVRNTRRGKGRAVERTHDRAGGYRKAGHLIQLAKKFGQPIVICLVAPSPSSEAIGAESREVLGLPKHILSQWQLKVPILLLVLTTRSSCAIFGSWLADKIIALEQTQFLMTTSDQRRRRRIHVSAKEMLRWGVIDKTIPVSPKSARHHQAIMSYRMRAVLSEMLDEVSYLSPTELMVHRRAKLARVEAMSVKLSRRERSA
jgi:acetyl-CoA carboxylase alpha subunit